jgi:hypothetical protein
MNNNDSKLNGPPPSSQGVQSPTNNSKNTDSWTPSFERQSNSTQTDQNAMNPTLPSLPNLSLPKGGGAIQGMGEKFSVNALTGTEDAFAGRRRVPRPPDRVVFRISARRAEAVLKLPDGQASGPELWRHTELNGDAQVCEDSAPTIP